MATSPLEAKTPAPVKGGDKQRPQVLTIIGEQVSLVPTGLSGADNIIVNFDDKYKPPGLSKEEVERLKQTLQRLFSGVGIYFGNRAPNPPCNKEEKNLVLQSLEHRFFLLRKVVAKEMKRDSLHLRQSSDHLFNLKGYIEWFRTAACSDEKEEEFRGALGKLSDDEIKQLIKQFVFLILQGQNPLKNYMDADPNPAAFLGRLKKGAIGDFSGFLDEYSESYPIPERIAKVIQVADLDLDAVKREVEAGINQKLKEILHEIRQRYGDDNDPIWQGIDMENVTSETILAVFDKLIAKIASLREKNNSDQDSFEQTKQTLAATQEELKGKNDEIAILNERILALQAQVDSLTKRLADSDGNVDDIQATLNKANETIAQLQENIRIVTAEKEKVEALYHELLVRIDEQARQIEELTRRIKELEARILELQGVEKNKNEMEKRLTNAEKFKTDIEEQLKRCRDIEKERDDLKQQLTEKENELAALQETSGKNAAGRKELEKVINDLRAENERLTNELETLGKRLDELTGTSTADVETIRNLRAEIIRLMAELANKDTRLGELQDASTKSGSEKDTEIQRLRDALDAAGKSSGEKDTEIARLTAALATLEKDQVEANRLLQDRINELTAENKQLQTDLETLRKQITTLQNTSAENSAVKDAALKELGDTIQRLETENTTLQKQLVNIGKNKEGSNKRATNLEKDRADLEQRLRELAEQLATAQKALKDLQESSAKEIERLQRLLEEAQLTGNQGLEALRTKHAKDLQDLEAEWQRRMKEQEEALLTIQNALAESNNDRTRLLAEIARLAAELEAAQTKKQENVDEIEQQKKDLEKQLKDQDEALQKRIQDLLALLEAKEKELTALRNDYKNLSEKTKETIDLLNQQLEDANTNSADTNDALEFANQRIAQLQDELVEAAAAREAFEGRATAAESAAARLAELEAKLETLAKQLREAQEALERLEKEKEEMMKAHKKAMEDITAEYTEEWNNREQEHADKVDALEEALATTSDARTKALADAHKQEVDNLEAKRAEEAKRCEDRIREAAAAANQQITNLQQQLETLRKERDEYAKSKGDTDRLAKLNRLTQEVANWIRDGANPGAAPQLDADTKTSTRLQEVINAVNNLPKGTAEGQKEERENAANRCYLIFFASYLMGRHFPDKKEQSLDQPKKEILSLLHYCFYGPENIYTFMEKETPEFTPPADPMIFLLNTLTKLMTEMEVIHDSRKKGAYALMPTFFDKNQMNVMREIGRLAKKHLKQERTTIDDFQRRLQNYINIRGGPVDRDLSDMSLEFSPIATGGHIGIVMYSRDPEKVKRGVFAKERDLGKYVLEGTNEPTYIDPDEARGMIGNDMLNFPFLFYLYIFVMKDYLRGIDTPEQCPLPTILEEDLPVNIGL